MSPPPGTLQFGKNYKIGPGEKWGGGRGVDPLAITLFSLFPLYSLEYKGVVHYFRNTNLMLVPKPWIFSAMF